MTTPIRARYSIVLAVVCVASACPAHAAEHTVGWRGDGSGAFPDAAPVAEFSETTNVLWKTPMPDWSNGSPVVVGGRVFVCSEPNVLICLDADTGKVLWQTQNDHLDLLPPDEAARAKAAWAAEWAFERERSALRHEWVTLQQRVEQNPADAKAKEALDALSRRLAEKRLDLREYRGGYADDAPERREQEKRRQELDKRYGLYFDTWMRWDYWIGFTMATPVSDGRHVWAVFGSNTVVCYDLDGNRRWMKWFPKGFDKNSKEAGDPYWGGYPRALFVASPVLIGDTLVVQSGRAIRGLDAATGEPRWEQDIDRYFEYAIGTPAHLKLGETDVVVTAFGDVRRVSDGRLLATGVGFSPNGASPAVHGDVVFFENGANPGGRVPGVRHTIEAVRLAPEANGERVDAQGVWSDESHGGFVSPVYHDGLLYHVDDGYLTVRDAATGKVLNDPAKGGKPARVDHEYSNLTLAGKYLIVSDNKGGFAVWTAGPKTEPVARNALKVDEPVGAKLEQRKQISGDLHWQFMFGVPFFDGTRMYVRSYDNLYCIGQP